MGKSSKQQTTVSEYYASQHLGICIGPVEITRIIIKEKVAWTGSATVKTQFKIHKDGLFGDSKKEGGVRGVVHYLPGADDQILYDELAVKLGRANGADCPGYRGIASVFFTGQLGSAFPRFEPTPRRGFYWTANNPYLPGIWITVRRAPVGLDPDYAMVPAEDAEALGGPLETIIVGDTFPLISLGDPGYPPVGSLHPGTIELGPYAHLVAIKVTTGLGADDIFVLDGVDGETIYDVDTVLKVLLVGQTFTIQVRNLADWECDAFGTLIAQPISLPNDANPAHIIYEALTNVDWGMGSPSTAIDVVSFEDAMVTLFDEGFGLSMIWTRQGTIEDFVQEVLDHIQAVLFVDPATGLLTLKLIRGDYDPETLPEISPSNANLGNFGRKLWGEIANEIVVTWTNPDNEQEETVVMQDLASIATQGGIISDGRNYYGVRNSALAARLAQRDLRSAGAPLASCECEVDRTLWEVRPASVMALVWPEYGLAGVAMRVTSVDYGRPGEPTIKLTMVEDVYGLDVGAYTVPPPSSWVDPSHEPDPLQIEQVFTLPLFMAAGSEVAAFIDDPTYPEVVAGTLGTTDDEDAYAFDLWNEVTLSNGDLEWQALATNNILGHAELAGALDAEASTAGVTFDAMIGETVPTLSGFVLIGDDGEEGNEIALIAVADATYTLTRGALDTVPRAWLAGTPVWFIDDGTIFEDPTVRSSGETVEYKFLTRTSLGMLELDDADLVSYELTDRPWLPNRPANVLIDGVGFNTIDDPVDMTERADPWVTVDWVNRNRLLEDSQVLGWTEATMTPETGQTTTIEVLTADLLTVLTTHDGLTGTTFDVPDASFAGQTLAYLRVSSKRTDADGTFASLQAHGLWVQIDSSGDLITEEGDRMITEDCDPLVMED